MKTLLVALQGLRGAPIRSALVVLTLTLGMLGLVAVVSATAVMHEAVTQKAVLTGGDRTTIQLSVSDVGSVTALDDTLRQLQVRTAARSGAATLDDSEVSLWADNTRVDELAVTFATASLRDVRPFPVAAGEWISRANGMAVRIVLNEAAMGSLKESKRFALGRATDPRTTAIVIGSVRDGDNRPHAYVEVADYLRFSTSFPTITIALSGPTLSREDVLATASALTLFDAPFTYGEAARSDQLDGLASEVATTAHVLLVLGVLALASTVVGILNIGLATARTRSREFALRRTMGASRRRIAAIVMVESQLLALASAAIAFAASYALFPLIVGSFGERLGIEVPPFQPWYGVVCLIVAVLTAAISTLIPALLSYGRDLSEVMRS